MNARTVKLLRKTHPGTHGSFEPKHWYKLAKKKWKATPRPMRHIYRQQLKGSMA